MARTPKHLPEQLLTLARAAITENPNVRILDFRKAYQIGSADAQAVLTAARWELQHGHYAALALDDLHPRYRDLVVVPEALDLTSALDLNALPVDLRADVDRAIESTREALATTIEALRATARRIVADVQARATADIRTAEAHAQEIVASMDSIDRQAAEAREETARVREQLGADVLRLSQEFRDERRERSTAEAALQRSEQDRERALDTIDRERDAARATAADLTRELADARPSRARAARIPCRARA